MDLIHGRPFKLGNGRRNYKQNRHLRRRNPLIPSNSILSTLGEKGIPGLRRTEEFRLVDQLGTSRKRSLALACWPLIGDRPPHIEADVHRGVNGLSQVLSMTQASFNHHVPHFSLWQIE